MLTRGQSLRTVKDHTLSDALGDIIEYIVDDNGDNIEDVIEILRNHDLIISTD